MRLTKTALLKDLHDAAALQAWHIAEQLKAGDLTVFQQAYFLNELSRAALTASINIVDANDLLAMMAEVVSEPVMPTKPKPSRTRKPPATAPAPPMKTAPKKKLPPKKLHPRKKNE